MGLNSQKQEKQMHQEERGRFARCACSFLFYKHFFPNHLPIINCLSTLLAVLPPIHRASLPSQIPPQHFIQPPIVRQEEGTQPLLDLAFQPSLPLPIKGLQFGDMQGSEIFLTPIMGAEPKEGGGPSESLGFLLL
jgi:hypothetical protein